MSNLGYIKNSYGKSIDIAIANTYSYNVLSSGNLPDNTIIISSPMNENNDDRGTFSLFVTDYKGQPVRLTYALKDGAGLRYLDDSIKVEIDENTIVENNGELSVNIDNLIDNNTIIHNDKLYINVDNLDKASEEVSGVFKIDNKTIKESDGELYVVTSNLAYANSNADIAGIFIGDGKYINVEQGQISINQENLDKASKEGYGLIRGNNNTVSINNGVISVITENLDKCDGELAGVVMPDNDTIILNENSELQVNTDNLDKITSASSGVFKYDPNTFIMDNDVLKVKNYDKFDKLINDIDSNKKELEKKIDDVKYLLDEYEVGLNKPEIIDFHATRLLTTVLEKPQYVDQPLEELGINFVSVEFMVATNCPFIIAVGYEDNIDPQVTLYSINYNTTQIFPGNSGLKEIFQTTEEKPLPVKFVFLARNYFKKDKTDFSTKTKIKITISYPEDVSIYKSVMYSIVRFNSCYNEEIEYDETNIESYI